MAGSSLGVLTVDLIAKIAGFTEGLTQAEKKAQKSTNAIEKSFEKLKGVAKTLGAAFAVDMFAGWIGGALEFADASQEAASASGVLTNEFLKLSGAAKLFGQGGVDIQKGLVSLGEQISKNASALTDLGIATRDSSGHMRGSYEVMLDVADVFKKMPDGVEKTAMAVEIFGKRIGPGLVPMLNEGRAGIEGVADSIALISPKLKQVQGEWETNTFKLGGVFDQLRNSLAEKLMPRLNDFVEWFVEFLPHLTPILKVLGVLSGVITGPLTFAFKSIATTLSIVVGVIETFGKAIGFVAALMVKEVQGDWDGMMAVWKAGGADLLKTAKSTADQLISLWGDDAEAAKEHATAMDEALHGGDQARMDKFLDSMKTLQEKESDHYAARLEEAKYFAEQNKLSKEETNALIEREYADHLARLKKIEEDQKKEPEKTQFQKDTEEAVASTEVVSFQQGLDDMDAAAEAFRIEQAAADEMAARIKTSLIADEIAEEVESGQIATESAAMMAEKKLEWRKKEFEGARGIMGNLSVLMNGESKRAFEIGKKAAIGGALMDTYKAATGAYAALSAIPIVGPALGVAAAAAAVAAGMVNVNAIRSQTFGGGGGSPAVPKTASINAASQPVGNAFGEGGGSGRNVFLHGIEPGSLYTGQQLLEIINIAIQDGGTLRQGNV